MGNPGPKFERTRHNIGFLVLDALCEKYHGKKKKKDTMEVASIICNNAPLILVKPQTFMNASGKVVPAITKKGAKPEKS